MSSTEDVCDEVMDATSDRWADPYNFITDVFRVRTLTGELVPYTPYPYAVDFMKDGFADLNMDRVVLKSRQIGFSTAMEQEAIMTCLTFPDIEVSVLSHQYKAAKKIVAACAKMIKNASIPLPIQEKNIQVESLTFDNGSRIVPYSSNPDSVRSENILKAYLDEFAFFPDQEGLLAAIEPKMSRGGSMTITSTPLSNNDEFMRIFNEARNGDLEGTKAYYHPMFEPGTVDEFTSLRLQPALMPLCPDIDIHKRPENVRLKSPDRFMQEYMCIPIDESTAYYPHKLTMACVNDVLCTQMREEAQRVDRTGKVWIGVDVALVHDETALVVVYVKNGTHYLVHYETTRDDFRDQIYALGNLVHIYRPEKVRSDKTGTFGIHAERELRDKFGWIIEGVTYTNPIKQDMAVQLKTFMQNTAHSYNPCIYIPNDKELLLQLMGVKVEATNSGNIKFSGKDGGGLDDIVNALWLALPPFQYSQAGEPVVQQRVKGRTVDGDFRSEAQVGRGVPTSVGGLEYAVLSSTKNNNRRHRHRPRR